jgi:SAM-dependent methyltransferase
MNNNMTEQKIAQYAAMAKQFMNKPIGHPNNVVGNYAWHEKYPYERYLLTRPSDESKTVVPMDKTLMAVDFGCGPGRMVNRMSKFFKRVDGIDVSSYALEWARQTFPENQFYEASGADCGAVPADTYDFVYNTISIQHIPCRTIRQRIYEGLHRCMKDGAAITLQLAYNPTYIAGVWSNDTEHASYESDFFDTDKTNGHADCVINAGDLDMLKADFAAAGFKNIEIRLAEVASLYPNLEGEYHAPYWASHWLFIYGNK